MTIRTDGKEWDEHSTGTDTASEALRRLPRDLHPP